MQIMGITGDNEVDRWIKDMVDIIVCHNNTKQNIGFYTYLCLFK